MVEEIYYYTTSENKLENTHVGQTRPALIGKPDMGNFDLQEDGLGLIRLLYARPTDKEIEAIAKGSVKLGFIEIEGNLLLVGKFGNSNWQDYPFHMKKAIFLRQPIDYEKDLLTYVLMIDTVIGKIKVVRKITMPVQMLKELEPIFDKQMKEDISQAYYKSIASIQARYTTNDLVKKAKIYDCADVSVEVIQTSNIKPQTKNTEVNTFWIKKAQLTRFIKPFVSYHAELPEELKPYYCYSIESGHSFICLSPETFKKKKRDGYLLPVPVKMVLRNGYEIKDGYLVCNSLPYDKDTGLEVEENDFEYEY
jgi:hypothetical protein